MSDYYEGENSCIRCLRSSPIASLLGFIAVLIGGGAFGGATIFARRFLDDMLSAPHLFPCLEYVVYGLMGATGLFAALAYFVCAISSGRNAKQCFESTRKSICGRCCNMLSIICVVFGILLWTAIICLMSYSVISFALLMHRHEGPTRLRLASLDPSILVRGQRSAQDWAQMHRLHQFQPKSLQSSEEERNFFNEPDVDWSDSSIIHGEPPSPSSFQDTQEFTSSIQRDPSQVHRATNDELSKNRAFLTVNNFTGDTNVVLSNQVPQNLPEKVQQQGKQLINQALDLAESARQFFKCDPNKFDLSYYGLYDENGLPIYVAQDTFMSKIPSIMICVSVATGGIFLMILGYLQILLCMAMNYARLQERRYYEASDAGEEGVALQQ
ncbi:hypothetical protein T265_00578 [Opisthorchis viverrini]|uniref:Uncharacterized protein n=1 Tax=Opisthorchis viverrini TaxID=6198 RepID=A0A075AJN6_OPIVI|nr:hypothetical protein T265_00578 [Opisthorchis viverrini]KER33699.1 hypothetical protein T265_00578 [Opisthorchis viverrini]